MSPLTHSITMSHPDEAAPMPTRISNEDGKTLSKNSLYAPLIAYDQSNVEPANYLATKSSIPKSLQENSLIQFWRAASVDYHRQSSSAKDAKNGGSRPLFIPEIDDRVRQRAVSLLRGGIQSTVTTHPNSHRKRERKSRKERKRRRINADSAFPSKKRIDFQDDLHYLRRLNANWNEYMMKVLEIDATSDDEFTTIARPACDMSKLDFVGSHFQIATCSQDAKLVGQSGVLLGVSRNTWKVAILRAHFARPPSEEKSTNGRNIRSKSILQSDPAIGAVLHPEIQILMVPKRGSSLMLRIPAGNSLSKHSDGNIELRNELIAKPKFTLCLLLDAGD
jgi:hypothetical protein